MKKIRIGNDIQVRATLSELGTWEAKDIKSVCCYFVRAEQKSSSKYPQYYEPTQYSMNCCGHGAYNVFPNNVSVTDPHLFPGYNGFGVQSTPFEHTPGEYRAPVKVMSDENRFEAFFPAKDQRYLGTYKTVFVVSLYEYGWNTDDVRTFTIDKGETFMLTNTGESSSSVIIDLDIPGDNSVTIYGDYVDTSKTTLPSSVTEGDSLIGKIYTYNGYIISGAIMTINNVVKPYPFILNQQYIEINQANITGDVVINLQFEYVGEVKVNWLLDDNIDTERTVQIDSMPKGTSLDTVLYAKDGYIFNKAQLAMDGVIDPNWNPEIGFDHLLVQVDNVTADSIVIIATVKVNEASS